MDKKALKVILEILDQLQIDASLITENENSTPFAKIFFEGKYNAYVECMDLLQSHVFRKEELWLEE